MAQATIPSVNDVDVMLEGQRREWEKMRDELRPAVDAFTRIEAMLANYERLSHPVAPAAPPRPRKASGTGPRHGTRGDEFVKLAMDPEGISVSEAAHRIPGMDPEKPTYLYTLAKKLVARGQLRKDGKRYYAVLSNPVMTEVEAEPEAEPATEE